MPFQPLDWVLRTNIYEVNVRQYTHEGTFNAFAQHLPRLKDMGVQTLWFMPIHPIGKVKRLGSLGSYYSISDHKAINSEFGTLDDFKALIEEMHQMNFKVIIDWVANHTAWDHVWTKEHPDFFLKDLHGNFISPFDWSDVIQIDHNNIAQQDAMIAAMKFWIHECDIDGFRCDMAHLIPLDFWKRARTELDKLKSLFWLAETEHSNYHEVFDTSYTWKFLHKMEDYAKHKTNMNGLIEVLQEYETNFTKNAIRMFFTSNHDENSHSGSEYERFGDAAMALAVFCATWEGIPLIYSGQELPLKKRLKFFDKDEIHWSEGCKLHQFYKTLLNLHSSHPALAAYDSETKPTRIFTNKNENVFAFLREKDSRQVLVILNLSPNNNVGVEILNEKITGNFKEIFSEQNKNFSENKEIKMNDWGFLVFVK